MAYIVYASLGSNINPRRNILEGLSLLTEDPEATLKAVSPVYRTKPVKMDEAAEPFHNLCLELETDLLPERLKERLVDLEDELGRQREPASITSRVLDLDILIYCPTREDFSVHPQVHQEAFVIVPLADLVDPGECEFLPGSRQEWLELCEPSIILGRVNYDWPEEFRSLVRPSRWEPDP